MIDRGDHGVGTGGGAAARPGSVANRATQLLRLITCGSVDDGKSTLIGRLLHDTRSVHRDQWEAVRRTSLGRGDDRVDLALITDGLRAEREQGITIDVAYRHFSTPTRQYILADTPGHVQYTRNMVTGASTAELALILVDARHGIVEQTRRHAYLAALLGIHRLVLCVNKMDLVGFDEGVFRRIADDFGDFVGTDDARRPAPFDGVTIVAVPLSALAGDGVARRSERLAWHDGPCLLDLLESAPVRDEPTDAGARFPVQWVIRPQSDTHPDYRGYAGRMAAGRLRPGDEVMVLPAGHRTRIASIELGTSLEDVVAPHSATVRLTDALDVSRGDMIVGAPPATAPMVTDRLRATLVWLAERPLAPRGRYLAKHGARTVRAMVARPRRHLDLESLRMVEPGADGRSLELNGIAEVAVRLAEPIVCDPYARCRETGSFILIDELTNATVAAGLIASEPDAGPGGEGP